MSIFGNGSRMGGWMGQPQQEPAKVTGTNVDATVGDNVGDNVDAIVDTVWQEQQEDPSKTQPGNPNQQQQQQTQAPPLDQQLEQYLKSQGLGEFMLDERDLEDFKNGNNVPAVLAKINQRIQQSHIKALENANKMINTRVEAAVQKALDGSKEYVEGKELRQLLTTKLPYTKDPAIAPVAETVFARFIEKGLNREKAIEAVDKFFKKTSALVSPENGGNNNTGGSYRQNMNKSDQDWLTALKGG